jgi:hypothetical protein
MGVGVEHTVEHDLPQHELQQAAGQRLPVKGLVGDDLVGGSQRRPVQPLHDQDPFGAQRPMRDGDPHRAVPAGARGRHRRHVARLDPEVQLLADRVGEAVGQVADADRPRPAGAALQRPCQPRHDVQVALDHRADPGPLHLHGHLGAGPQAGGVHLGDGGRRQRLAVEPGEHLVDRPAELGGEHLLHLPPWRRGGLVPQAAQLVGELRGEQVGSGRQHLTELHEGDPALVQRLPQRPRQPRAAARRVQLRPPPPAQVRGEAVADRDAADLGVPAGADDPSAQRPPPLQRPRNRPARHQRLGDHQEHHRDHQRARAGQDEEPHRGDGLAGHRRRPHHRPGDRARHREPEQPGDQQPHHAEAQPQQPPREQREPTDDPDQAQHDEDGGHGDGEESHRRHHTQATPRGRAARIRRGTGGCRSARSPTSAP